MKEFCKGVTKNGEPCRISANLVDGYCRLHRGQAAGAAGGCGQAGGADLVLERSPTTGIPRYVPCAGDPKSRWLLLAAVSVVALLTVALSILCCRRGKK